MTIGVIKLYKIVNLISPIYTESKFDCSDNNVMCEETKLIFHDDIINHFKI